MKYGNFELSGMIYCIKCNYNWGAMLVHKKVALPTCKIAKFVVVNPNNMREKYKKWKEVPFHVQPIEPNDLTGIDDETNADGEDDEGTFWQENDNESLNATP